MSEETYAQTMPITRTSLILFFSVLEFAILLAALPWLAPTLLATTSVRIEAFQKESALACPNLFNLNCKRKGVLDKHFIIQT